MRLNLMGTTERTKVGMFPWLALSSTQSQLPYGLFFVSPPDQLLSALLILNTQTCTWHESRTEARLNEASAMKLVDGANICEWQHPL
jgi:hypothetical protein